MTMKKYFAATMLFLSGAHLAVGASQSGGEAYYARTMPAVDAIAASLPDLTTSAEQVADLYVHSDLPMYGTGSQVFEWETDGRCGGLMRIQHPDIKHHPHINGIVLYGLNGETEFKSDLTRLRALKSDGCRIVLFGRSAWRDQLKAAGLVSDWFVSDQMTGPEGLIKAGDGREVVTMDDLPMVLSMWTWTGEFVAACTRLGKMPPMYKGYAFPGGVEREKQVGNIRFHPGTPVPVAAGIAGKQYIDSMRDLMVRFHETQSGNVEQLANEVRDTLAAGHKAYCMADSHTIGNTFKQPHDPKLFILAGEWGPIDPPADTLLKKGDLAFGLGYVRVMTFGGKQVYVPAARAVGARLAWSIGAGGTRPPQALPGEVFIDELWPDNDSMVQFPGYDIKILPPSGVIDELMYNMTCADILQPGK